MTTDVSRVDTGYHVPPASTRNSRWALAALGAVVAGWVIAQFLVTFHMGIGWDETVYLSQYAHGVPPGEFSAPRARGVPLIVAPLVAFTTNLAAIRTYLTLLSGVLMFGSFLPWLRLRLGATVPLAAALFASVWVAMFYGNEAMPNMFVAYGAVAATGLFLVSTGPGRHRAATVGLLAVMAGIGLTRPSDSAFIAVVLVLSGLLVRRWRRLWPIVAVIVGELIGWVEWFAESFAYFRGPIQRLHAAGAENETGLHFSLMPHINAFSGAHLLCRPECTHTSTAVVLWFAAIPIAVIVGCVVARRRAQFAPLALAAVTAGAFAGGYFVTVAYAAPRFLLPSSALAALPIAELLRRLVCAVRGNARPLVVAIVVVGLAADLLLQASKLHHAIDDQAAPRAAWAHVGGQLTRDGVTQPCLVFGKQSAPVAFFAGCRNWNTTYFGTNTPRTIIQHALRRHETVIIESRSNALPAPDLASWRRTRVDTEHEHWYLYLAPPAP